MPAAATLASSTTRMEAFSYLLLNPQYLRDAGFRRADRRIPRGLSEQLEAGFDLRRNPLPHQVPKILTTNSAVSRVALRFLPKLFAKVIVPEHIVARELQSPRTPARAASDVRLRISDFGLPPSAVPATEDGSAFGFVRPPVPAASFFPLTICVALVYSCHHETTALCPLRPAQPRPPGLRQFTIARQGGGDK